MVQYLPIRPERLQQLKTETESDEALQLLKTVIRDGWPEEKHELPIPITPYHSIRDELSIQVGIIFRGERVVVHTSLRTEMKCAVHQAHLGTESCLRRARECLYWPGMNADMKDYISRCDRCRNFEISNQKETLMPHELPPRPWEKVGTDLFSLDGRDYLITVDYLSNFWEVDRLPDTKSTTVIRKLKAHFARNGSPNYVISDGGPQYVSEEFKRFAREWDFEHVTSSPHHQNANGKAEAAVKMAKRTMRKCKEGNGDIYKAFLELRNTPVTLYRDYTELARRCEISQSAVGSPKNAENRCILFSIFTPWRCYGDPTAIVAFLRRFHGVLSRSCGVLVGDRLRARGVLTACTPRFRSGHRARTAFTPRWRPINSTPFCCGWRTLDMHSSLYSSMRAWAAWHTSRTHTDMVL